MTYIKSLSKRLLWTRRKRRRKEAMAAKGEKMGGKSLKETPLPKQSDKPFHLYMLTL